MSIPENPFQSPDTSSEPKKYHAKEQVEFPIELQGLFTAKDFESVRFCKENSKVLIEMHQESRVQLTDESIIVQSNLLERQLSWRYADTLEAFGSVAIISFTDERVQSLVLSRNWYSSKDWESLLAKIQQVILSKQDYPEFPYDGSPPSESAKPIRLRERVNISELLGFAKASGQFPEKDNFIPGMITLSVFVWSLFSYLGFLPPVLWFGDNGYTEFSIVVSAIFSIPFFQVFFKYKFPYYVAYCKSFFQSAEEKNRKTEMSCWFDETAIYWIGTALREKLYYSKMEYLFVQNQILSCGLGTFPLYLFRSLFHSQADWDLMISYLKSSIPNQITIDEHAKLHRYFKQFLKPKTLELQEKEANPEEQISDAQDVILHASGSMDFCDTIAVLAQFHSDGGTLVQTEAITVRKNCIDINTVHMLVRLNRAELPELYDLEDHFCVRAAGTWCTIPKRWMDESEQKQLKTHFKNVVVDLRAKVSLPEPPEDCIRLLSNSKEPKPQKDNRYIPFILFLIFVIAWNSVTHSGIKINPLFVAIGYLMGIFTFFLGVHYFITWLKKRPVLSSITIESWIDNGVFVKTSESHQVYLSLDSYSFAMLEDLEVVFYDTDEARTFFKSEFHSAEDWERFQDWVKANVEKLLSLTEIEAMSQEELYLLANAKDR